MKRMRGRLTSGGIRRPTLYSNRVRCGEPITSHRLVVDPIVTAKYHVPVVSALGRGAPALCETVTHVWLRQDAQDLGGKGSGVWRYQHVLIVDGPAALDCQR